MAPDETQAPTVEELQARIKTLEAENRRWMRLAGTNRLTDLPNSLMLYEVVLPAELRKVDERGAEVACILLSPDDVGEVNKTHGRAVGDELILQIAEFLKERMVPDERLYHPDGVNFAILLSEADEGRARRRATAVRTEIKEATFTLENRELEELTCSAGIGTIEGAVVQQEIPAIIERLYQQLSDRLYRAKQRGGNTVVGSERSL
ncbi:MAG: GGDEF domain-containing protein [Candidatus Latescibacteria bacterium]|nr:GGDEF domain-containing protein [Candidatus Latescibacterota bacterium]